VEKARAVVEPWIQLSQVRVITPTAGHFSRVLDLMDSAQAAPLFEGYSVPSDSSNSERCKHPGVGGEKDDIQLIRIISINTEI
jgi:hypothetical protein